MIRIHLKSITVVSVVLSISAFNPATAQVRTKSVAESPAKSKTAVGTSQIADSYEANYYYLNNKEGDSQGLKGELKASSTAITLKTIADNLAVSLKINETPAFQISKGVNGDPTFFGENAGWSRFVGNGSIAFFGGNKGMSSTADIPNLFIGTNGRVGVNTTNAAYQFQLDAPSETFGIVQSYGNGGPSIGFRTGTSYGGVGTPGNLALSLLANGQRVGTFLPNGNFGIGNTSPAQKLHVDGDTYLNGNVGIGISSPTQRLQVQGNALINGTVGINNDLTGISQSNLNKYSMFVNKGILSEDFALGPRSSWADFVFAESYQLPKLNVVEQFIVANHHLPEMPSAQEIKEAGYSLHDMNVKMLQKVEELTLYAIEQQKEIDQLKSEMKQYKGLALQIELLKSSLKKEK